MKFSQAFLYSLYFPKKAAKLRFCNMKNVLGHFFLLMAAASLPSGITFIQRTTAMDHAGIILFFYLPAFYLFFAFSAFLYTLLTASLGIPFRNKTGRTKKLPYHHLFIFAVYSMTPSVLIYFLAALFFSPEISFAALFFGLHLLFLHKLIASVPPPAVRSSHLR